MFNYLIISSLYRFISGGLIVIINWELTNNKSINDLAISIILTFLPAVFIPLLFNKLFENNSGSMITKLTLMVVGVVVILIGFINYFNWLLIILNFILWILYFLIETGLESWFAELIVNKKENYIEKYSSLSLTLNQVFLMIGPIFIVSLTNYINLFKVYILLGLCYMLLGLFSNNCINCIKQSNEETNIFEKVKIVHYLMNALIWPILGSINFMIPVFIYTEKGNINEVAILDSILGISMAIIGMVLGKYFNLKWLNVFLAISIIIFPMWVLWGHNLIMKLIIMFLFGLSFGGARILFKKFIVVTYSKNTVSKVYSIGNACALPILGLCICFGLLNVNLVWLPSFSLLLILLLLLRVQLNYGVN